MNSVGCRFGAVRPQWMMSFGIRRHCSPSSQYHSSPLVVLLTLNCVFTTSAWSQHFLNGKRLFAASVSSAFRYHSCTSGGFCAYSAFQVAFAGPANTTTAHIQ